MATSKAINEKPLTETQEETMNNLVELFGTVLDFDIIQNVASNCNYNAQTIFDVLTEMSPPPTEPFWCKKKSENNQNINVNQFFPKPSPTVQLQQPQISKSEQEFNRIISDIQKGYKILVLMRGLPGSGKSSLAKKIVERGVGLTDYYKFVFSADDYFINPRTGVYEYHPSKIKDAHDFNQDRTRRSMQKGVSPIVIDNTNTQIWEMKPYTALAIKFGYVIEIVEPLTSWKFNIKELCHKNTHNVPRVKIQEMYERYDKNVRAEELLLTSGLAYANIQAPSKRTYPPINYTDNTEATGGMQASTVNNNQTLLNQNAHTNNSGTPRTPDTTLQILSKSHTVLQAVPFEMPSTKSHMVLQAVPFEMPSTKSCMVLQAAPVGMSKKNTTCSDDNIDQVNNKKEMPKLNLASWGLAENSLSSWEVVSPVKVASALKENNVEMNSEQKHERETSDTTTNTSNLDFLLLTNGGYNSTDIIIKNTKSRDINQGVVANLSQNLPKKILLDKSSMATEENLNPNNAIIHDANMKELLDLFSDIPVAYLKDVYEKCEGDLNWAVDLLLDDTKEFLPLYQSPQSEVGNSTPSSEISEREGSSESAVIVKSPQSDEAVLSDTSNESSRSSFEENLEIKKIIENNVVINKDHYSEHVLKVKNLREGIACVSPEEPSTSTESSSLLDDFEIIEDEGEQMMELNLGENVLSQLEAKFGRLDMVSQGFQPVIKLPVQLAQHLHALYVDSVFVQLENQNQVLEMIIKEDEEFAKKLQIEEDAADFQSAANTVSNRANGPDAETPNFRQIMVEQLLRHQQAEEWKKLTPDTLAAKLTMQKLMSLFPCISKGLIEEILYAHDNSYQDTVQVLSASVDRREINDPDGTMSQPPITEAVVNEMKFAQMDSESCVNVNDERQTAEQYREEAKMHLQKHKDLIAKAQQSLQRKQYAVAQFYSEMARTHTKHYEQANGMAAAAFLEQHSVRLQNYKTIDLHYLYVKEALSALDVFIDRNITILKETRQQQAYLFVITGRGKNSSDGKSKLKPAIQGRLRRRQIPFTQGGNPGVIRIRINVNSLVTSDLS